MLFLYTTVANIFERPEGIRIAAFFILAIIIFRCSPASAGPWNCTPPTCGWTPAATGVYAPGPWPDPRHHRPRAAAPSAEATGEKLAVRHRGKPTSRNTGPLFLEVMVDDSSTSKPHWKCAALLRHGYHVLEVHGPVVPNTIASVLLHIRDVTGLMPHIYFRWTEGNPVATSCGSCSSAKARSRR